MSGRYGRNQRRRAREEAARLQLQIKALQSGLRMEVDAKWELKAKLQRALVLNVRTDMNPMSRAFVARVDFEEPITHEVRTYGVRVDPWEVKRAAIGPKERADLVEIVGSMIVDQFMRGESR